MLKLMTFNIRYGLADDGENRWENRRPLVIDRIISFNPDLLGMQECQDNFQAEYIKNNLSDYEFIGVRREGGSNTALEMAPLLFKKSVFQLVQKGCFWLSETPQVPGSKNWGSTFPRTATWVELFYQTSGKSLIFVNTHFDYATSAIHDSARLLQRWILETAGNLPVLVTGDFNADKNSPAYRCLTIDTSLQDIYRYIHQNHENEGTFHGFGQAENPTSIDWMLASHHFRATACEIDRYHEGDLFPSDHYPVNATLEWK
jgi:endonuclease/exonuclease/phosphatase family metal-dependent hydrolase